MSLSPCPEQRYWAAVVSVALALPIFVVSGLYRAIFRYSGWPAMISVSRAMGAYSLLYASAIYCHWDSGYSKNHRSDSASSCSFSSLAVLGPWPATGSGAYTKASCRLPHCLRHWSMAQAARAGNWSLRWITAMRCR